MLSVSSPAAHSAFPESDKPTDVRRLTLDNGLTVLIKPSRKASTVSLYLGVESGSADEAERLGTGLSHYLEHMLFKGTPRRKSGEIEEAVRRMGGATNAYTSYDVTVYYLNVLAAHFESGLDLLSDVAFHSTLPPEELESERQVILSEFRMNDDRISRQAHLALWESVFASHPYGRPVIGYRELFEKVSREDLLRYYKKNYVPNNMTLSVVGDFDAAAAEKAVRRYFEPVPRGLLERPARLQEAPQLSARRRTLTKKSQHARLIWGYPGVALSHPDAPALDVLSGILGEGGSSRLSQALREREKTAIDVESYNSTLRDAGLLGVTAVVPAESVDAARASIARVLEAVRRDGVTEEELKRVKNQTLARMYANYETHDALAHDILTSEIYAGNPDFSREYAERVKRVTASDVQRAAVHYLTRERLNEILLMPESGARAVEAVAPVAGAEATRKIILPNGLKVLLTRDASTPTISAHFAVHGGVRYEDDRSAGSSRLVAKLLEKGTAQKGQAEIQEAFEGWGGRLDSFSGQNSYGLSIGTLSDHASEALALMAELLTAPAFDEAEFEKERALQLEHVLAKKEDVFSFAQDALRRTLFSNHPYRLDPLGTEASLKNMTRSAAADFYKKTMSADRAVLSISGDFDPAAIEKQAAAIFSKLPKNASAAAPGQGDKLERPALLRLESPREQAVVMLAFHAAPLADPRRHALEILNAVLNDSAGRLYRTVRNKAGLSYLVGSSLVMGVDPGYLVFFASVRPDKADEAMAMLVEEARLLRKQGISETELADAKTQLLGNRERSLESKESRSLESAFSELYGIPLEEFNRYAERVRAVTLEDVRAAIDAFVDAERSARVTVVPEPEKKS